MSEIAEMKAAVEWAVKTLLAVQEAIGSGRSFAVNNAEGWHLSRLAEMLDEVPKLLPLKVGDRVRIAKTPNCNNGWHSYRNCLKKGAFATIRNIEFHGNGEWRADIELDKETYYSDLDKKEKNSTNKHVWPFRFEHLEKI